MSLVQSEQSLSARLSGQYKQDKKVPMLINITDGRLLPNSINVRALPEYRPYTGSVNASLDERMAFISSSIGGSRRRVVDTSTEEPAAFDLGKATKDEIIDFAFQEFGMVLTENTDIRTLRRQVHEASDRAANRNELS